MTKNKVYALFIQFTFQNVDIYSTLAHTLVEVLIPFYQGKHKAVCTLLSPLLPVAVSIVIINPVMNTENSRFILNLFLQLSSHIEEMTIYQIHGQV